MVSIVFVNYRVSHFLRQALLSLRETRGNVQCEIIVVDNASEDNSREIITQQFPEVHWIQLKTNIGFGKACNVGAHRASGTYLLLLNPDTLLSKNTLDTFLSFFSSHPDAGCVGPKILNPNGSLQISCRRSFPTPAIAIYRFIGLSRLFPTSRRFGRYNMTFLDPDTVHEVDAISGSCMFLPLKLFHEIGGFDERFFLYGEDLDLCAKIKERGGSIWYTPETQIIHFKGKSSHQRSFRSGVAFYEAMILFSRKYRSSYGTFFPSWLIAIGVFIQALFGIGTRLARALTACFIDAVLINLVLWLGISIRFHFSTIGSPYQLGDIVSVFIMHILLSVSFLAVFVQRGVYTRERGTHKNTFYSGLFASVLFIVFVYFYQSLAYSRISLAVSSLMISGCLVAWRVVLPATVKGFKKLIYPTGNVLIMGDGDVAAYLIRNVEEDKTAHIVGVIWSGKAKKPADFSGYPVLGTMAGLKTVLERFNADLLLIATIEPWFAHVVEGLASTRVKNLTIQWVPSPILSEKIHDLPPVIPLNDFQNFTV